MDENKEKMLWRCRRGMRELDSVLKPFTEDCYDRLSAVEKKRLRALLGYQDAQILDWILGREISNEEGLQNLINSIIQYSKESRVT